MSAFVTFIPWLQPSIIDRRNGNGFGDNDVAPISGSFNSNVVVFFWHHLQSGDRLPLGIPISLNLFPLGWPVSKRNRQNSVVVLDWTTESEVNNDFFTIERSEMGREWVIMGTIKGAGTSKTRKNILQMRLKNHIEVFLTIDWWKRLIIRNSSYSTIVAIRLTEMKWKFSYSPIHPTTAFYYKSPVSWEFWF